LSFQQPSAARHREVAAQSAACTCRPEDQSLKPLNAKL
jgi:hypothetical protein